MRTTDEEVWVTDIFWSTTVAFGFGCEARDQDMNRFIRLIRASKAGERLEAEDLPAEMWEIPKKKKPKKFPHMFRMNGFDTVSGEMAEVLRRHNIGDSKMFPVTLLKKDRKTPHEGEFFFLNIREKKEAFDPVASRKFTESPNREFWKGSLPLGLSDNDIAVDATALVGPDLWLDPSLFRSYFIKGALARELIERKMIPSNRVHDHADIARCIVLPPPTYH